MSHSITVTRTTTTTSGGSAIIINTGYFKTWPGILKIAQLILGIVVVGLVSYYYNKHLAITSITTFFLLTSVTFLIGTFLLVLSSILSFSTGTIISKTIYEFLYHGAAFLLYLAASLALLIEVNDKKRYYSYYYNEFFAASIIGLVIAALYLLSTILGFRSYRGL